MLFQALYANKMRQQQLNAAAAANPEVAGPPLQPHPANVNQLSLPEGWELKFTEAGEKYYVDHVSKKTQWEHPAITLVTILPYSFELSKLIVYVYRHSNKLRHDNRCLVEGLTH